MSGKRNKAGAETSGAVSILRNALSPGCAAGLQGLRTRARLRSLHAVGFCLGTAQEPPVILQVVCPAFQRSRAEERRAGCFLGARAIVPGRR